MLLVVFVAHFCLSLWSLSRFFFAESAHFSCGFCIGFCLDPRLSEFLTHLEPGDFACFADISGSVFSQEGFVSSLQTPTLRHEPEPADFCNVLFFCFADPAHLPWAHHGVIGNRAMGSVPLDIKIDQEAAPGE